MQYSIKNVDQESKTITVSHEDIIKLDLDQIDFNIGMIDQEIKTALEKLKSLQNRKEMFESYKNAIISK